MPRSRSSRHLRQRPDAVPADGRLVELQRRRPRRAPAPTSRSSSAATNGAWSSRTSASTSERRRAARDDRDRARRAAARGSVGGRPRDAAVGGQALAAEERRGEQRVAAAVEDDRQAGHRSRRAIASEPSLAADAEEPGLGEDELERGADELAVRLAARCAPSSPPRRRRPSRARGRGGRRPAGGRARMACAPSVASAASRPAPETRKSSTAPAGLAVEHLEAEHVDAVRGEVPGDRRRGSRAGRAAGAGRARRPGERARGAVRPPRESGRPRRRAARLCSCDQPLIGDSLALEEGLDRVAEDVRVALVRRSASGARRCRRAGT